MKLSRIHLNITLMSTAFALLLCIPFSHTLKQAEAVVIERDINGSGSCTNDVMDCGDGTFVNRDPANGCEFRTCAADGGTVPTEPSYQPLPTLHPNIDGGRASDAQTTPSPTPSPSASPSPSPSPSASPSLAPSASPLYKAADFYKDNLINDADYAVLKRDLFKTGTGIEGDIYPENAPDGKVNLADYVLFTKMMQGSN